MDVTNREGVVVFDPSNEQGVFAVHPLTMYFVHISEISIFEPNSLSFHAQSFSSEYILTYTI